MRLTVDGESLTQPLRVDLDPRSSASASDLESSSPSSSPSATSSPESPTWCETIRGIRRSWRRSRRQARRRPEGGSAAVLGDQPRHPLRRRRGRLHSPDAEVAYDILATPGGAKLYSRLGPLMQGANDRDGPPTQGMREVSAELAAELAAQQSALDALLADDLARINGLASELSLPYVLLPVTAR